MSGDFFEKSVAGELVRSYCQDDTKLNLLRIRKNDILISDKKILVIVNVLNIYTEAQVMKEIMIIDDDVNIGNMLEETLIHEGYSVTRAYSGTEALLVLSSARPDLILLDLMLPGLSGEELLPKIQNIPVIIVSAKIDTDNKVDLLLNGASDYVTKPFVMKELLARISVQLRIHSASGRDASVLRFRDLTLNTETHVVSTEDREIHLTRTEYAVLKLLMKNPEQVVSKSVILDKISEDTPDCTESSLKQHISNLRKKLKSSENDEYIDSVWGIGFKMKS